jgi:hypothetical protein
MPFVRASSLGRKSLLYVRLLETPMGIPTNIGSFSKLFMAYAAVHDSGMTRSMPFYDPSVLSLHLKILASILALSQTLLTHQVPRWSIPYLWVCMSMTLFTSRKTQQLNLSLSAILRALQSRFLGYCELVPGCTLLVADNPIVSCSPSQPIRFCL